MAKKTTTKKPVHSIGGGTPIGECAANQLPLVAAMLKRAGSCKAIAGAKLDPGTHRVDVSLRMVGDISVGEDTVATITKTDITAAEMLAADLDGAPDFEQAMQERVKAVAKLKRTDKGQATLKVALERFNTALAIHADRAGLVTKEAQPRAGAVKGDPQIFVLEAVSE
jgi:hypothetical protein